MACKLHKAEGTRDLGLGDVALKRALNFVELFGWTFCFATNLYLDISSF